MSSNSPFKSVESSEEPPEESSEEPPEPKPAEPRAAVDPARVEELEQQVTTLEEKLAEAEGEDGEESEPDPDYDCSGEDCEGFAVEEIESEHVTTEKKILNDNNRPMRLECPHCGEEVSVKRVVPKGEQKTTGGGSPVVSNKESAGRKVREDFEEADQEDVLDEADSRWLA
jgi:hypothetical protein